MLGLESNMAFSLKLCMNSTSNFAWFNSCFIKMKIIISISDSFCANFIKGQGKFLTSLGHQVIVVSGPGEEIDLLERSEPVKVIRIPFAREISPISDFISLIKVIKLVWREKPDIINAGNPKTGFLFSVAHLLFWGTPLIFTLRGLRSDTLTGWKKRIVRATEKISCTFSNKVIAISPSLREHAISLGLVARNKCLVLGEGSSNGVNTNFFTKDRKTIEEGMGIIEKFRIPPKSFKFIFVGRVTKDKGLAELLEAFSRLHEDRSDTNLIIVGPIEEGDPLPEQYYKLIEDHPAIFHVGKLLDVRPIYSVADALVLYSHREGFGNVVIEGASMGLPTIVADIPGLRDTTEANMSGLHVEPQEPDMLYQAMSYYVVNPEVAKQHGENGATRARHSFKNEVIWNGQLSLYKSMIV